MCVYVCEYEYYAKCTGMTVHVHVYVCGPITSFQAVASLIYCT